MNSHPSASMLESPISASRRSELLHELAGVASQAAHAQIDGLTTDLADALLRASAASTDEQEARRCYNAAGLLKKNRYPFYYVVSERLGAILQREILLAEDPSAPLDNAGDAPPSLPPDVEIDKKLCLIKASQAIESEHADRLAVLNLRMAALLGCDTLATAQNPFRPHVFLTAVHESWCEFQPDTSAHHLVFRLLGADLCIDMGPVLHALNTTLARRGIAPHALPAAVQPEPEPAVPQAAPTAGNDDPLASALRKLFPAEPAKTAERPVDSAFPSLFQEDMVQTSVARHELLGYLTRMQSRLSVLLPAEIRRQAPELAVSQADDNAIGLVAKVFDAIRANPHIPEELRTMIASLHLPVLKTVLTDSSFFFKEAHPARRAIESLVRIALGWDRNKGQTDPAYPLIARSVRRIEQEADQHLAVYVEVYAELDAFMKREATASAQMLAAPIALALQQEKTLQAAKAARHEVALRIGTGEVVAFVETFLEDKWVDVLTLAYTVKDDKPQAADSAIKTMDDLVWSVKPKITAEERKELLAKLPSMVAMLNKWLDLIKWNDPARQKFFDELARCHASIVRAPLELSPQRQVELAIQVAQKAAERREKKRAQQAPEPVPDAFDKTVADLSAGIWIEFRQAGRVPNKLRLAWISPMRNLYLFATRERKEALSMSAEELAQALRDRHAQIVPGAGLVGRVLAEALGLGNDQSANNAGAQSAA